MRLYKPKDPPKPHRNAIDCPLGSPSSSSSFPGSPTPHKLKRAAEAVSKQISGHNAMVARFKEMKLPRPQIFTTVSATPPQTVHSHTAKQSKATKRSSNSQNVSPVRSPNPRRLASPVSPTQRTVLSAVNTNSRLGSPTKPPGLGFRKSTTRATPLSATSLSKSVRSQAMTHYPSQRAASPSTTSPTTFADVAVASASSEVDIHEPLLPASCFRTFEDDPESEDDLFGTVELSSVDGFEAQIAQIFAEGLGPASETDIARHGEMPPPKATPEASVACVPEPMSAALEWWQPAAITAVGCGAATVSGPPKARSAGLGTTAPDQKQVIWVPQNVPSQFLSLSSADYEYVASLGRDAFVRLSLGRHKQSQRKCVIKVISNAIVEEECAVRAALEEQRIMREASRYPFLLGLMASFHGAEGFYLVSDYCRFTLFDEHVRMSETHKKLALAELACAVDHLHSLGIIHRDINLENVMLKNDGHVVLGNFGLALRLGTWLSPNHGGPVRVDKTTTLKARGIVGTLPYLAPEMLRDVEYSYGVDWFAYGVFLHVFCMDKFPWLGKNEDPASFLKEMVSTISLGSIFENGAFGKLLNKLLSVDENARANFSVIRSAKFFTDINWDSVIPLDSHSPSVSPRSTNHEIPHFIGNVPQPHVDSDPYPGFTWLNPSMIVEPSESTHDIGDVDCSLESSIVEPNTPSHFDAPCIVQSSAACGSLHFFDSFSLLHLYRHSTFDFDQGLTDDVLRRTVLPLDEDHVPASPAECTAAFEDSNICLGRGMAAMPTYDSDDDEVLVRMSIKSLDFGEEPLFDLPPGWKEAFVSPAGATIPPSSQAESTKNNTSVLPKLKSLWKRTTSKFVSR